MFDWKSLEGEQVLETLMDFVFKCRDAPNFQDEFDAWDKEQRQGEINNE